MKNQLSEFQLDGMLFVYYLNKLVEFKLIEGNMPRLTPKGFELAHDEYEDGRKLSNEVINAYASQILKNDDNDTKLAIIDFVEHIQDVGFEQMKSEIENLEK